MLFTKIRAFWRRNVSRRWINKVALHNSYRKIPPMYDETISGKSLLHILDKEPQLTIYATLGKQLIDRHQRRLLSQAFRECNSPGITMHDLSAYMKDYLIFDG